MTAPASRTGTRIDEPLDGAGRAPALDYLVPGPANAEPDDALAGLLGDDGESGDEEAELTEWHYGKLAELDRLAQAKSAAEKSAEALGKQFRTLQAECLEWIPELGLNPDRPFDRFADEHGNSVLASLRRDIYPRYRDDPQTGRQYSRDEVFPVLEESDAAHVIVPTLDSTAWPAYVRDRVKAWRRRLKSSPRGIKAVVEADDGPQETWVDHDGLPLRPDEQGYPNVDILALPRAIRAVIEPSVVTRITFTRRKLETRAAVEMEQRITCAADQATEADGDPVDTPADTPTTGGADG